MAAERLVLIVEDELKIAELLRDYLQAAKFATHLIHDGSKVLAWARAHQPDLVLLDLMLPGKDGLEICRELRHESNVPIVITTARVDEIDRLLGLELGADDYICKPFSPREVVARVKTILRRVSAQSEASTERAETTDYRGVCIDTDRFEASVDGVVLDLTPVEFRLLALLIEAPGRVYSREKLLSVAYNDGRVVADRTIDSHIKNLRRKLRTSFGAQEVLHSIYGVGYKFE